MLDAKDANAKANAIINDKMQIVYAFVESEIKEAVALGKFCVKVTHESLTYDDKVRSHILHTLKVHGYKAEWAGSAKCSQYIIVTWS